MSSVTRGAVLQPIYHLFDSGTLVGWSDAQLLDRFVASRDDTAFEALVARHGRSVLAVCRDVLRDQHDAEDAFQATFLILARKAGSLWVGDSLAAWLHRVAHRVAVEANRQKSRRQAIEKTGLAIERPGKDSLAPAGTLLESLHEEIARLPEKYRAPIILCDLEDLTRDEAAHRLGCPPGTVAGRLARARSLLRDRLIRRGHVEVSGFAAVVRSRIAAPCNLPFNWIKKTAVLLESSPASTMKTAFLARGVIRTMMLTKLKSVAILSLVAGLAPAIFACTLAKMRHETIPEEESARITITPQASKTTQPASGLVEKTAAKVRVTGAIVLQDRTPAKDVRVFFSTRDDASGNGLIRAQTVADGQGRFSLDVPPVEGAQAGFPGTGILWAYRPGSLVSSMAVYRGALPSGLPQRLVIGPPGRAMFEVRSPDGKPVVGARIEPRKLNSHFGIVPDSLDSIIGAETVTDIHGGAVMTAFFPDEIASIRILAEGYGQQVFNFRNQEPSPEPKIISLRPVGRLKGRLVGGPDAIRHRRLDVVSFTPPGYRAQSSFIQNITTDDDGRFDIMASPVGPHGVGTVPRYDFPWYASTNGLVDVAAGRTTEVVLNLKPAIRVHGAVVEKGTGKPIAGVRVAVTLQETGAMTTGPDGHYEGYVPPEVTYLVPRSVPSEYAMPIYSLPQLKVPEGVVDFQMPPLELIRAGEVRGLVVDDDAHPVAGAEVEASWDMDESRPGTGHHQLTARTGADGHFVVDRVPIGAEVALSARHRALRTREPKPARVGEAFILRLTLSNCVALEGRVLDPAGRPVAGARVHLRSPRRNAPYGPIVGSELVEFEGGPVLITDAEGRFQTPAELDPDGEYAAFASAEGFQPTRTIWMKGRVKTITGLTLRPDVEVRPK